MRPNFISLAAKEQNAMQMEAAIMWEEYSTVVTMPLAQKGC
jgi:hypothetical protein